MRAYFNGGSTRTFTFRKEQLKKLRASILKHEEDLYGSLYADLKKSREETWVTETGMVISELNAAIKNLRHWMGAESVSTNLLNLPSGSRVMKEPLGVVLIIGPWNYPFQLLIYLLFSCHSHLFLLLLILFPLSCLKFRLKILNEYQ